MEVVVTPTLPQRLPRRKKKTKVRESLEDHLNLVNLLKIIGLTFDASQNRTYFFLAFELYSKPRFPST